MYVVVHVVIPRPHVRFSIKNIEVDKIRLTSGWMDKWKTDNWQWRQYVGVSQNLYCVGTRNNCGTIVWTYLHVVIAGHRIQFSTLNWQIQIEIQQALMLRSYASSKLWPTDPVHWLTGVKCSIQQITIRNWTNEICLWKIKMSSVIALGRVLSHKSFVWLCVHIRSALNFKSINLKRWTR